MSTPARKHLSRKKFQPFLRFWLEKHRLLSGAVKRKVAAFQPFLRFWGLCIRFLWVFKFFFGFL